MNRGHPPARQSRGDSAEPALRQGPPAGAVRDPRRGIVVGQLRRLAGVLLLLLTVAGVPPAQALSLDPATGGDLQLPLGEGRIVRFAAPVESVFVADDRIADIRIVSPGVAYVFGKANGSTNLIALDSQQRSQGAVHLQVSPAIAKDLAQAHPATQVQVRSEGKRLLASGPVADIDSALELNAMLTSSAPADVPPVNTSTYVGSPQVNIRVRFAEVSREQVLRYGVNWNALINSGSFSFGLITGGPLASSAVSGATNLLSAGFSSSSASVDVLLDALQSNGFLEILAEPNITALSGQTASFLAGGEIPVPVPVNNELIGIDYKSFGVSLQFTPTLLPNHRIALQVRPEVSSLSTTSQVQISGFTVPSFQVRRADTRVEVGSGQTFAIAGLFQRSSSQDVDKLPLLGDLPILGNLFKSKRFQRSETELVILITPYIVEPVSERTLATPLDPAAGNPAWQAGQVALTTHTEFGFYVD
jgi:pilus assembly protein CpaC